MKAKGELAVMSGWHAAAFARTAKMKSLEHYLKPAPTPERKREEGARNARAMFERVARKTKGG